MNYTLALLTSPRKQRTIERTLASFEQHVSPRPAALCAYADGDVTIPLVYDGQMGWDVSGARSQGGFCRATRNLWKHVARSVEGWVFWLEDDFTFTRSVDLRDLACVLEAEPQVKQMAFYRNPVNAEERAAGGFIKQHQEEYAAKGGGRSRWFETRRNWTTNPALFRAKMCRDYDWPDPPFCEGKIGFRIREREPVATFGIWGAGDPWVEHIGEREGRGY